MLPIKEMILDTETTGLPEQKGFNLYYDPKDLFRYDKCRLVQMAYIIIDGEKNILKKYNSLIKPNGFVIDNEKFHGISHHCASQNGKDIVEVLNTFCTDLSQCSRLIAHNIKFDYNVLLSECYRHSLNEIVLCCQEKEQFCTMEQGRKKFNLFKSPKLIELFTLFYPDKKWEQKHDARDDVISCLECYKKF